MSNIQELILSTSSSIPYTRRVVSAKRPTFAPPASTSNSNNQANGGAGPSSITLHDLNTSAYVHSFKPSNSGLNSVGVIQSKNGEGGGLLVSQEGKALLSFWAWQKVSICSVSPLHMLTVFAGRTNFKQGYIFLKNFPVSAHLPTAYGQQVEVPRVISTSGR